MKKKGSEFKKLLGEEKVKENEPLYRYTGFRTGGNADVFLCPRTLNEIKKIFCIINEKSIPFFIMGKGTNVLISDKGFRGVVISTQRFEQITVKDTVLSCESGLGLRQLLKYAIKEGLSGIEFLAGIPGTVGGAVISNAGLKNIWISEKISEVEILDVKTLDVKTLSRKQICFGYRKSGLEKFFVHNTSLKLDKAEREEIRRNIGAFMHERKLKQPMGEYSAGSVFKNPSSLFSGELIEKCNLKGYSVGGARVSDIHANFIVNAGNATSADIYRLILTVKNRVFEKFGINLKTEIKIIGEF
jgi:UDP-N-acetylmuramate dehydrogenase